MFKRETKTKRNTYKAGASDPTKFKLNQLASMGKKKRKECLKISKY